MTDELRAKFDLLPCPFCGGGAEVIEQRDEDGRFAAVGCSKCGAGTRQHYFCGEDAREHVVDAWNKRAANVSRDAEVEALKRDAKRYRAFRKALVGEDEAFLEWVLSRMPDKGYTATEFDAAVDAAREKQL